MDADVHGAPSRENPDAVGQLARLALSESDKCTPEIQRLGAHIRRGSESDTRTELIDATIMNDKVPSSDGDEMQQPTQKKVEKRSSQPAVQLKRKAESLVLVPVHLSVMQRSEPDAGWVEATVSLYRHVLPSLGRSHIIEIVNAERTETCLLIRSSDRTAEEICEESTSGANASIGMEADDVSDDTSSFSDSEAEGSTEDEEEDEGESTVKDTDDFLDEVSASLRPTAKDRIVAAITWEHVPNTLSPRTEVVQLTLIGCRTKYQELGLGSRLMRAVKDPRVVGDYDVIVTFADHNAVPFFCRQGFNDDAIMNSRYAPFLDDDWDQSILMSFCRPRAAEVTVVDTGYEPLLHKISASAGSTPESKRIQQWKDSRIAEYSQELTLLETMENELLAMRRTISQQSIRIATLNRDYADVRKQMLTLEYEYNQYRCTHMSEKTAKAKPRLPLPQSYLCSDDAIWSCLDPRAAEFALVAESMRAGLQPCSCVGTVGLGASADGIARFSLTKVLKTCYRSDHPALTRFCQHPVHMVPHAVQMPLFFGAPAAILQRYFEHGFPDVPPENDAVYGGVLNKYGRAYYFSKNPGKAHHFTDGQGSLLVASVLLGHTATVIREDPNRTAPPAAGNGEVQATSILVPGRRLPSQPPHESQSDLTRADPAALGEEEYAIFDGRQILPLYLVYFTVGFDKQPIAKEPTGISRHDAIPANPIVPADAALLPPVGALSDTFADRNEPSTEQQ